METIYEILTVISGIAFLLMIVGLFSPSLVVRWGEKITRGKVIIYYGVVAFALAILGHALKPEEVRIKEEQKKLKREQNEAALEEKREQERLERERKALGKVTRQLSVARTAYNSQDYLTAVDSAAQATRELKQKEWILSEVTVVTTQAENFLDSAKSALDAKQEQEKLERKRKEEEAKYTTKSGTLDRLIEKHVHHVFGETVSRDEGDAPLVISISAGPTTNVAYRMDETIWSDPRSNVIREANQFMQRVFTDPTCSEVRNLLLRPHAILIDQYGRSSEDQIGRLHLGREVAAKINWDIVGYDNDMFERLLKTEGKLWLHPALNK